MYTIKPKHIVILIVVVVAFIGIAMFGMPIYRVWSQEMRGKAQLAEAMKIENGTLTSTYIQYLWVKNQENLNEKTVIYIPTEANLPILEAGKRNNVFSNVN